MADISKITLPHGESFDIKDAVAREAIAGGVAFIIATDASTTPKGISWKQGSTTITGTLEADESQPGAFYLVPLETTDVSNVYSEYIATGTAPGKTWEKLGDTKIHGLSKSDTTVLGTGTTFSDPATTANVSGGTTDKVLGEATTFALSSGAVTVNPSTTNIKATASGVAVGANGTADAITGFGTHSTETFVKSVSPTTSKLVTDSISGVSGSTIASKVSVTARTASKATAGTAVAVATVGTSTAVADGTTTATQVNTDILKGASVSNETLVLGACSLDTTNITPATSNGTITPYTFEDVACSAVTANDVTVPIAEAAKTIATGEVASDGDGSDIVTGVAVGDSAAALTALGTPTTAAALTGVRVTAQPTVDLSTGATAGEGVISVATGITSASVGTGITVGTNDKVDAVTNVGTVTVPQHSIDVTADSKTVLTDVSITN